MDAAPDRGLHVAAIAALLTVPLVVFGTVALRAAPATVVAGRHSRLIELL